MLRTICECLTTIVCVKDVSEIAEHVALVLAAVMGGIWAFYLFRFQRQHETAMEIDFSAASFPRPSGQFLAILDVVLKNRGKRAIEAHPDHGCHLKVRRVDNASIQPNTVLDWSSSGTLVKPENLPQEIDLLWDYRKYSGTDESDYKTYYLIEPGETEHRRTALVLPPGDYLATVNFVGRRIGQDEWNSLVHFRVGQIAA